MCTSGCITRSRGRSTRSRRCIKQNPVTYGSDCLGPSERVALCDTEQCPSYSTSQGYASNMCKAFLREDPSLETKITAHGTQPKHFASRVELACQIHCKKPEGGWSVLVPFIQMVYPDFSRYHPNIELADKIDVYFPDGSWCGTVNGVSFFCL